jgi:4-hydroxy-3-methylbut-2-enyl diphosphate reductase
MVERARNSLQPGHRIFLLHDIIHNPRVCEWLRASGHKTLDPLEAGWWRELTPNDTVVVSAFGATTEEETILEELGVRVVETTCPSVREVWTRISEYAGSGFTTVLHGRRDHPETRAALSRARAHGGHYIVVRDADEAQVIASFITGDIQKGRFLRDFKGAVDNGFEPTRDLAKIGIANQTTMVASDSAEVAKILQAAMEARYGKDELADHYRSLRTICRATEQRQTAAMKMAEQPLDLLIVVGGHKSSNTRHLAELTAPRVAVIHIEGPKALSTLNSVEHLPPGTQDTVRTSVSWLESMTERRIGFAGGASTPDAELGETISRVLLLLGEPFPEVVQAELRLAATKLALQDAD